MGAADVATYERDGFLILRGFADAAATDAILDKAIALARRNAACEPIAPAFVQPESNLAGNGAPNPEDAVAKIYRLHRLEPFHFFATSPRLTDLVAELLGVDDVDCFGSQLIFKNPGAWGQPCHQDSHYFPFDEPCPVVGAWLAVTEASSDNGCLHVVPGSHREPTHDHVPDRRPEANLGYMEIVDHDLSGAVAVEMRQGDLLLFDSFLMHFSRENTSTRRRGAMIFHFAPHGTVDHAEEHFGFTIHDWMSVRRA